MAQLFATTQSGTGLTEASVEWQALVADGVATQIHPLRFYDIYQDIALELPEQPNINIVKAEVNKVIRRVNDEIGLWRELIQVTPSTITTVIDEMTTTAIELETTDEIEDYGRIRFDWDYNTTLKRLRLSDDVFEVLEVYIDDVEWEKVTYASVTDSDNSSEKYWAQIGRFLYFPIDLADTSGILRIRVKRQYTFVDNVVNKDAIVDLPENYRQLLISGVLYALTSRPKYREENVFSINKEIFERELSSLRISYANLEATYTKRDVTYKY